MVGGQTAEGARTSENWTGNEPIHFLLDSQMSIHVSSQGSSDEPDEDSVRSTDRQHRSQGSVPTSGNSGSKRKTAADSTEPNIRGKKYKERTRQKQTEVKALADAGLRIAAAMEKKDDEETASLTKLEQLEASEEEHYFLFNLLENSSYKRKWFIMNEREKILSFVRKEMRLHPSGNVPRPNGPTYTVPNQGFPQPNPAANAGYTQFYPPPNPAASNYYFRPNDPNRGGNFM